MIDNWAVTHRPREGSFDGTRGLRMKHRTTVKSMQLLPPPPELSLPLKLPHVCYGGDGKCPFPASKGRKPVWVEGYVGLSWRPCNPEDFLGTRPHAYVLMQTPCYDAAANTDASGDTLPAGHELDDGLVSDANMPSASGAGFDGWMRHLQLLQALG